MTAPRKPRSPKRLQQMHERLIEMAREQRQRNLDNAVLLAQQAARGHGPLIEHFGELGRRFGDTLRNPPKPDLRLVKGGDA